MKGIDHTPKTPRTARPYEWDFDGGCAPHRARGNYSTFTLGVFQWLPKAGGKGLKRGPVAKRFGGYSSDPAPVYARARAEAARRNAEQD